MKFMRLSILMWVCCCSSFCLFGAYDYELAIAAIFQDEAPYLREWIEYYKLQGAEHFYLYNNLSQDHYDEVLAPYIANGDVDLIQWDIKPSNWSEWDRLQVAVYNHALRKAVHKTKWLAIVDLDEFVVPVVDIKKTSKKHSKKVSSKLLKLLAHYASNKQIGGICIPWVFFGTSHVPHIPSDQLLIETLLLNGGAAAGGNESAIWNQGAYKSIVRPEYVDHIPSPHYAVYKKGRGHIMMKFNQAQINHYWSRDEYFLHHVKIPRRAGWNQSADSVLSWEVGMNNDTAYGKPILQYVPELRQRMGLSD